MSKARLNALERRYLPATVPTNAREMTDLQLWDAIESGPTFQRIAKRLGIHLGDRRPRDLPDEDVERVLAVMEAEAKRRLRGNDERPPTT